MKKRKKTVKEVVNEVSNVGEGRGGGDGGGGDAIAALRQGGDDGEVGGTNESRVIPKLRERFGANQNGAEFQKRKTLPRSGGNAGLHIEEHYFGSVFTHWNSV